MDDLATEQRHLDRAYEHLAAMRARVERLADGLAVDARNDVDAATARHQLRGYQAALAETAGPLCFGRIDTEEGERWYVGRRHVEDEHGEPAVVDWRAGVAVPFYRATFRDPLGLRQRRRMVLEGRRLVGCFDEDFDDPDSAHHASGVADPLLAELDRARTGAMRDIVATIQAEQDRVIRAPLDELVVVQGGPGTGKTAVALHRAALLLYEHRDVLEREGVLVVGPNRRFLRYISQVLPSLGEAAVVQTTVNGLAPVDVVATDDHDVAELKGQARMAELVHRAAWDRVVPPEHDLEARTSYGLVRLGAAEVAGVLDRCLADRRSVASARERFRTEVIGLAYQHVLRRRPEGLKVDDDVARAVRSSADLRRALDRAWPATTGAKLVQRLLTSRTFLRQHAAGLLDDTEQRLVQRRPAGAGRARDRWTASDAVLVDEADAALGVRPRRYGHVIVDEAQDLSAMAWRLVARRCGRFPSMTVLGDLAQATAPGAQARWEDVVAHVGAPAAYHRADLEVGYRVPGQLLDLANRLLPATGAQVRPPRSVRVTPAAPVLVATTPDRRCHDVAAIVRELLDRHASVAVLGLEEPALEVDDPRLSALAAEDAKGLEFDAVVVVDPAALLALGGRGARLLYIALTRAVQELVVVHGEGQAPALLASPVG